MNIGTIWLNGILAYEQSMKVLGLLPLVEQSTIWYKLQAISLERLLRADLDTGQD